MAGKASECKHWGLASGGLGFRGLRFVGLGVQGLGFGGLGFLVFCSFGFGGLGFLVFCGFGWFWGFPWKPYFGYEMPNLNTIYGSFLGFRVYPSGRNYASEV